MSTNIVKITVCFLLLASSAIAQHSKLLEIVMDKPELMAKFRLNKNPADSAEMAKELNKLIVALHGHSHLEATIDSVVKSPAGWKAYIYVGDKYHWVKLRKGNLDRQTLNKAGFSERFFMGKPFNYEEVAKLEGKVIDYLENEGYPFAAVWLDSLQIRKGKFTATLKLEKGPYITFDTITINGATKTKQRFFSKYLRVQKGQPFVQSRVDDANKLLKQLPFLTVQGRSFVIFKDKKAYLNIFVEDRKANQVDGILGLLPNTSTGTGDEKKMLITGQFNLALYNLFGTGKILKGEWEKFQTQSQKLDLDFVNPNLLGSNLELKADFNLLKQDSTFFSTNWTIGLATNLRGGGKFSFFTGIKTSRIGSTQQYQSATALPQVSDFNYQYFGLGYGWNNLDDVFYPKKGNRLDLSGTVGQKKIRRNSAIKNDALYDSIPLTTVQYSFLGDFEKYFRLGKGSVILLRGRAGYLYNSGNLLFINDLYRIGGLKILRGFNESAFYAQQYGVGTFEFRQYFDATSYLLLFADQGYYQFNLQDGVFQEDHPLGLGGGISFTTPAGIFNFIYALGKSNTQLLTFTQSKIHFGFVSRF